MTTYDYFVHGIWPATSREEIYMYLQYTVIILQIALLCHVDDIRAGTRSFSSHFKTLPWSQAFLSRANLLTQSAKQNNRQLSCEYLIAPQICCFDLQIMIKTYNYYSLYTFCGRKSHVLSCCLTWARGLLFPDKAMSRRLPVGEFSQACCSPVQSTPLFAGDSYSEMTGKALWGT